MGIGFWLLLILVPILMLPLGISGGAAFDPTGLRIEDRHVTTLLLTFGLGLVVEDVLKVIFGAESACARRPPIPGASDCVRHFPSALSCRS